MQKAPAGSFSSLVCFWSLSKACGDLNWGEVLRRQTTNHLSICPTASTDAALDALRADVEGRMRVQPKSAAKLELGRGLRRLSCSSPPSLGALQGAPAHHHRADGGGWGRHPVAWPTHGSSGQHRVVVNCGNSDFRWWQPTRILDADAVRPHILPCSTAHATGVNKESVVAVMRFGDRKRRLCWQWRRNPAYFRSWGTRASWGHLIIHPQKCLSNLSLDNAWSLRNRWQLG